MTTRDPPSRNFTVDRGAASDGGRELTESLDLESGAPDLLAVGTHERQSTSVQSPGARVKTLPPPPAGPSPRFDVPEDYLGAVLGAYRVLELLGKGGMGYVYRAEHIKLGREVALKLLRGDYASRRDAVARFFQEARTVNRVRHRNIVEVTDFVELDDGTTYIIMELLTGASLGAWARSGVDLPRALAVLVQICDGLGAAHDVGVVHRDLKPDNVIVVPTSDGAELVKLLDFGVAKLLNRDDESVGFETAAGSVIGTPAYMSPEQAGGMMIDARSDIYSLGAIMYELFCGEPMFRGRSFGEYVRKHLTEVPVPPRQTQGGAELDPDLEAVILRCLDKDPEQRFASVVELRDALIRLLGGGGPRFDPVYSGLYGSGQRPQLLAAPPSLPLGHPSTELSGARPAVYSERAPLPARDSRAPYPGYQTAQRAPRRWANLAMGATGIVALGAAGVLWYTGRKPPPPAARVAPVPAAQPITQPSAQPITQPSAQPTAQPSPQPTAQPIDPPAPQAALVELRFDSTPSGGVFAAGQSTELCRTPCSFNVELAGGPAARRDFVVRRDGYLDGALAVDLADPKREFHVVLQPLAAAPEPTATEAATRKRPAKHKPKSAGGNRTRRADRAEPAAQRAVTDRPAEPAEPEPAPPPAPAPREPQRVEDKPAPPTKPAAIDPSDTLDPFHHK